MNKDWFDLDEFQNFYEDLTSVKEKEFSLSDRNTDKNKDGEGSSIQMIKNENHDMLQTPPSHDLFKSNDALPALVSYTPESSQEEQKITQCKQFSIFLSLYSLELCLLQIALKKHNVVL